MNHSCGIAVTPQGIPILYQPEDPAVKGRPLSVVVRAERVSFPEHFVISDDRQSESVIVLPQALNQIRHKTNDGQMYLRVRGVVATSVSQTGDEAPVLLLADVEVLGPIPLKEAGLTKRQYVPPRGKGTAPMQGGLAPVFFNRWSPFLRDEELAGSVAWLRVYFPDKPIEQYNEKISHFLERHDALRTLSRSNSASFANISKEVANHRTAVAEFDSAQMNRQNATLTSNAGWESAEVAEKVVEQHKKALEFALHMDSTLMTVDKLCQCHAILCGNGLLNNAGTLRKTKVRVGDTSFQAPDGIQRDLDSTCRSLGSLEERLLWNSSPARRAIQAATLAAAVFYAIVDIHPFADGNGRLARIAMNWTLRRAGVPFVIQLFATPAQRREYTKAIKQTRTNTCLAAKGRVTQDQILDAYKATGALLPLVYLILNRLERTIVEFEKLEQEKGQLLSEEDEARASRLYRERAAKETCMICFDDNPNIATLCCGKAIHLNCMAEWLSQRNSCPQCRGELPYLPARMRAGRVEGETKPPMDSLRHCPIPEPLTMTTTTTMRCMGKYYWAEIRLSSGCIFKIICMQNNRRPSKCKMKTIQQRKWKESMAQPKNTRP